MKRIILFSALFSVFLIGNSQLLIINDTIFREGIYRTFEEFKYNNPSIDFNYNVIKKKHGYGVLNAAGQVDLYKLLIDKKTGKKIGKIFGFCDGKNVYIKDISPKLSPKIEFSIIEYFGKYCYYKEIHKKTVKTADSRAKKNIDNPKNIRISNNVRNIKYRNTKSFENRLVEKIIDINSGEVTILSKKTLRRLIVNNKELLDEFNNETQKSEKLKLYLIKYLEKE